MSFGSTLLITEHGDQALGTRTCAGGAFTTVPASRHVPGSRSSSRHAPIDRISLGRNRALYAILRLSETQ